MSDIPIIWVAEPVMKFDLFRWAGHGPGQPETQHRDDLPNGAAEWGRNTEGQIVAINFICPCGCKGVGSVPVVSGYGGAKWDWDGDLTAPTLSPSILKKYGCGWHGFLVAGVWKTCP